MKWGFLRTSLKHSTFTSPKSSVPKASAVISLSNCLEILLENIPFSLTRKFRYCSLYIVFTNLPVGSMSPPVETFPASELAQRIQLTLRGRRRKGHQTVLGDCELLEMVQYSCHIEQDPETPRTAIVKCEPIIRLFRKCVGIQDALLYSILTLDRCNDTFLAETTALEGEARR